MKIFYFALGPLNNSGGVGKKIYSQILALKNLGINVTLCVTNNLNHSNTVALKNSLFNLIWKYYTISKVLNKIIKNCESNTILYVRSFAPNPFTSISFLLPRKCKIIIEYQSIEPYEIKLSSQRYRFLIMDVLFGTLVRKRTDGIVGVTEEITNYELNRIGNINKPHITIGNGFEVDSVPIRNAKQYNDTELHLLCVANVSKWHGLDRLLKGMAKYSGNIRIIFHIAGEGAELPFLKQLVKTLNLQNRVIFHGFKTGENLDILFNTCHIAVGSIGIHRKGLTQTSELKAREYCARGIPYIIACGDPDFPDDFPYIHKVPPDESPVDIEKIIEFAQTACADLDHPQKMRAYALEYLDWSVKMKILKTFLENLIAE